MIVFENDASIKKPPCPHRFSVEGTLFRTPHEKILHNCLDSDIDKYIYIKEDVI
jgi:hypothetical protein